MLDLLGSSSSRLRHTASLFGLILVFGCGYADYEMRLNESKKYYSYLEKIEQSLAPRWNAPGNALGLRAPKQFTVILPPQPVQNQNGEMELPAIDPRQPDYVNLNFPGLFGAWESIFKVARPDRSFEEKKGYIYVLSNYWELAGEHAVDAGAFVDKLKVQMAESLRITVSDERSEVHPKVVPAYQRQLSFNSCAFKGKDIEGVNYTFEVYAHTQGSVIGVIVVVLPEGMDSPQKVSERIPMMLASFEVTRVPPKAGSSMNAPAQPAVNQAF